MASIDDENEAKKAYLSMKKELGEKIVRIRETLEGLGETKAKIDSPK